MTSNPPKYRRQRKKNGRDLAFMEIGGGRVYLGAYGSAESREAYARKVAEYSTVGGVPVDQDEITVAELVAKYWEHTTAYYRHDDGTPTSEAASTRHSMRPVVRLYGSLPASQFSPLKLKVVREFFIEAGHCRGTVNRHVKRIQAAFRWAVANELLPPSVADALNTVPGLRRGRSAAKESEPVRPVPDEFIDAVKPHVSRQVWAMIQLQRHTGMRSGEVTIMRGRDLDMTGKVWLYRPSSHKTQHHGHERVVEIGPRGQTIIREFLVANLETCLFSPYEAVREWQTAKRAARRSKVQPSQADRRRMFPKVSPGDRYTPDTYRRALDRACMRAWPLPKSMRPGTDEAKQWRRDHHWHPHQLRHNFGTMVRKQYGVEASRVVLGHHSIGMAALYSEIDRTKAAEILAKIG